jgi:hypothetical protein
MRTVLIAVMLLLAAPLLAQNYGTSYNPDDYVPYFPGTIQTPEIQLGSDLEPSIVKVPPVVVQESTGGIATGSATPISNATPASTGLLASRHFDYIVSPLDEDIIPGSMEDTTISLGDYARQLRAQKQNGALPGAMAKPGESR